MTVNATVSRIQYTATNGQTIFTVPFEFEANTDLAVYQRISGSTPVDATDILLYTTNYTVTGAGNDSGGSVTLLVGATLNDIITIEAGMPISRTTAFVPLGLIKADNLNEEYDHQVMIEKQSEMIQSLRQLSYPASATIAAKDNILPILGSLESWRMNIGQTAIEVYEGLAAGDLDAVTFLVQTADSTVPAAQVMGDLATGLVKNTTTTGVQSIAIDGTDYWLPGTVIPVTSGGSGVGSHTAYALLAGGTTATAAVQSIDGVGTSGQALISTGAGSLPTWQTVPTAIGSALTKADDTNVTLTLGGTPSTALLTASSITAGWTGELSVTRGGTGRATATAYSVICAGTTATGAQQNVSGVGTANQVLSSNGAGSLPTWNTIPGASSGDMTKANDTNVTLTLGGTPVGSLNAAVSLTMGWTGTLSVARGGTAASTAAGARTSLGAVNIAGDTMTGQLDMSANKILDIGSPTLSGDAANKAYVDNLIQNIHVACNLASDADIGSYTYDNGTLGVGATLTADAVGVLTIDSVATVLGNRILLKDQTAPAENGVYDVTTEGTGGVAAILTRASDYDEAADMQAGDRFTVVSGTANGASDWMMSQTAAITVGTTAITFEQIDGIGALLAANNLSDVASASTSRTNLGLGTMATQAASAVAITGGTIDGTVIGATTPAAAEFTTVDIVHTAAQAEDHALEIDMNAAGFGDTKSLDIDYVTGALAPNSESSVVLINIDDTGSTGGEVIGTDVLVTPGLTAVIGMRAGALVKPIEQLSGTFGDADSILNKAVDVTANLANGGGGGITIFVADNDTVTVGNATTFFEVSWELTTPSSGAGVAPTWEFSTGSGTWASFTPTDGTNGFRNTGVQAWDISDVPAWAVGTSGDYLIRITRTRNSLSTTPVAFETQIATVTEYGWDENGGIYTDTIALGQADENTVTVGGTSFSFAMGVDSNSSSDYYNYEGSRHSGTAGLGSAMLLVRSRGTHAAETVVQSGDLIGSHYFAGYDGTDYALAAAIQAYVNGTPGSGDMPGEIRISVSPDGSETLGEVASFDENGLQLGAANSRVTTIIDDDSMATASATNLSTSEAIKAYVDAGGGGAVVSFEGSLLLMGG